MCAIITFSFPMYVIFSFRYICSAVVMFLSWLGSLLTIMYQNMYQKMVTTPVGKKISRLNEKKRAHYKIQNKYYLVTRVQIGESSSSTSSNPFAPLCAIVSRCSLETSTFNLEKVSCSSFVFHIVRQFLCLTS